MTSAKRKNKFYPRKLKRRNGSACDRARLQHNRRGISPKGQGND